MKPVPFKGASLIPGPKAIPQCPDVYGLAGFDTNEIPPRPFFLEAWQPSEADKAAIARGDIIWVKIFTQQVQPMVIFTTDKNGQQNK